VEPIFVLWQREIYRLLRARLELAAGLLQSGLYLLAFGFGLGPVFRDAGRGSYLQFLTPGLVGMAVLFAAALSGMGVVWDRQYALKQALVAPVSRLQVMIGRTLGAATVAVIQGLLVLMLCLIAGFRPSSTAILPLALPVMVLVALAFSGLGMAIGSSIQSMRTFPVVINFAITPLLFLSGAFSPLQGLSPALLAVTNLNPLAYGIDGLRGTMSGTPHFSLATDLTVLCVAAGGFLLLGAHRFSRIRL
jgi:ABC-2 type transport system permease protein